MLNWSSSASFSASSSASSVAPTPYNLRPPPGDVDKDLKQPTEEVLQFTWIVSTNRGNNLYQCKLCDHRFSGQPSKVYNHFIADYSSQRVSICPQAKNLPEILKIQLQTLLSKKKRTIIDMTGPSTSHIGALLTKQARPEADAAILQYLVSEGVSPLTVKKFAFRNMLKMVCQAGSQYVPPGPSDFGLNRSRSTSDTGLGRVLHDELARVRTEKLRLMHNIHYVGGTLCNDGAKWRKRSLINSVLMTSNGPYYAQSTDATGKFKDATYLLKDIQSAISNVGQQNVFIVSLDGACKKTMKLIWDSPEMHQIFPQRCSTHGCNLLVADVGKNFKSEIALCVRLVKFVCNHDSIFAIFSDMPGSLQLLGVVETRFASQIYSSERILADKDFIKELFFCPKLRDYLSRAPADQRVEHAALEAELVTNPAAWAKIEAFVAVEMPIRTLLRISDGHAPNLPDISFGFERAKELSILAASKAENQFPLDHAGLKERVQKAIEKRKKDIVTDLCLAAAMVLPKHVYVVDGGVPYDPVGASSALNNIIMRYYKDDIQKQNEAFKIYNDFREKSGIHFGGRNLDHLAKTGTADEFWARASLANKTGTELFRKLVNGYCGQGESERMNKQVKKHRTTVRNRQTHAITASYMELDTTYKMIHLKEKQIPTNIYMECLRDKLDVMINEIQEEQIEQRELIAGDDNVIFNEEDDDAEDADYLVENIDLGRDALEGLLLLHVGHLEEIC